MTNATPWLGATHHVSPLNFAPEVRALYHFREPVAIQDFTFGKLSHMPGARRYSEDEYREIGQLLEDLHVTETVFTLTNRYRGKMEDGRLAGFRAVAKLSRRHLRLRAFVSGDHLRNGKYREEIDRLRDLGADALVLGYFFPASPDHEVEELMRGLPEACAYAAKLGLPTTISVPDISEVDLDTAMKRLKRLVESGIGGISFSDSCSRATPDATRYLVASIRKRLGFDIPLWYHAHDHLGLATANALAATCGGAWPQASAGGIADNGFASLEEVAVGLEVLYGVRTGLVLEGLTTLTRTVERITGIELPPHQPVSGKHVFQHDESRTYIGTLNGKTHLEVRGGPFAPELVGSKAHRNLSYLSLHDDVVRLKLQHLGLPTDQTTVTRALGALRDKLDSLGNRYPVLIDDVEVDRICRSAAA